MWVNDMPPEPPTAHDYRIHAGDTISVHVFGQETMTTKARVRTDGRIAFPILGEIEVRDKRPADLARELEARLTEYVVTPHVTVAVEDVQPLLVSVMGEVGKQGIYTLDPNAGVVQAIASAGGITDFADHDGIFVVRAPPDPIQPRELDPRRGQGCCVQARGWRPGRRRVSAGGGESSGNVAVE